MTQIRCVRSSKWSTRRNRFVTPSRVVDSRIQLRVISFRLVMPRAFPAAPHGHEKSSQSGVTDLGVDPADRCSPCEGPVHARTKPGSFRALGPTNIPLNCKHIGKDTV